MHYNYGEYSKTLNIDYKCGECSKTLKILSDDHCPPFVYFFVQKKKLIWSNMSKIWFDLCSKGTGAGSTYIHLRMSNESK